MKNYSFLFLIIASCNKINPKKENLEISAKKTTAKKELKMFYDSDKIEHFYLNISEEKVIELLRNNNKNSDQNNLADLFWLK